MNTIGFIKNPENKQKLMAVVLIAVVFIILFILYFYYKDRIFSPVQVLLPEAPAVSEVAKIKLNTSPLLGEAFQGLKKFGEYPLELLKEDFGKTNPFLSQ